MSYETLILPVLWAVAAATGAGLGAYGLIRRSGRFVRAAAAVAVAALVVLPALAVIPPGHRGVVYSVAGGVQAGERSEGVTLVVPWAQHVSLMSVRTQKLYSERVFAQSLDLQEITVVASVNYRVRPEMAAELYQRVGRDYAQTVIQPALFQRTKAAVGQIKAEDFAANRAALATTIQAHLEEQLAGYGIVVEFINVEDAIFDPAFIQAVKEKVVAEQEAQEQERLVDARKAEREQAIVRAQGIARANELVAASLTPEILRWRYYEVWDGTLPQTLVSEAAGLILDLGGKR